MTFFRLWPYGTKILQWKAFLYVLRPRRDSFEYIGPQIYGRVYKRDHRKHSHANREETLQPNAETPAHESLLVLQSVGTSDAASGRIAVQVGRMELLRGGLLFVYRLVEICYICLFIYLLTYLFIYLFVCLFVYLFTNLPAVTCK